MKSNVSLGTSLPLFAGWHDLGVQKYKISEEMTHKVKLDLQELLVRFIARPSTATNNV